MRLSAEHNTDTAAPPAPVTDPSAPDLDRPEPRPGEPSFERRFGRLQLDDQNLYTTTFSVRFADSGTTQRFWPETSPS